jgi:hypothetical protein
MLPLIDSGTLEQFQEIDWYIQHYETTMTVPMEGIGFRIGTPTSGFTTAGIQASGTPITYMENNSTPVFTDGAGDWKYGRSPLVIDFWESGAPLGVTRARYAVMHWRGALDSSIEDWIGHGTGQYWLGFSGNGHIRIDKDGSSILNARLVPDDFVYTSIINGTGNTYDVFYWQLGEPWGGFVGKCIPQTHDALTAPTVQEYREAPVLGASIIPYSASPTATILPRIKSAELNVSGANNTTQLSFTIPLSLTGSSTGWTLLNTPRRLDYTLGGTAVTLKRGELIELYGGFKNETYPRFRGKIVDFLETDEIATVQCESIEAQLAAVHVENYPDKISYSTFGYFKTETSSEPIYHVPAYDAWPLEYAVQDLCYRGNMDPSLFYGAQQMEESNALADKIDRVGSIQVNDKFTDTNGTTLNNHTADTEHTWSNGSTADIQSNRASYTSTSTIRPITASERHDTMRLECNFNFSAGASDGEAGIIFRNNGLTGGSLDGYELWADRTSTSVVTVYLNRINNGTPTSLLTAAGESWAANTEKRLIVDVEDTTYTAYLADADGTNRSLLGVVNDGAPLAQTEQNIGMRLASPTSGTVTADNLYVYTHDPVKTFRARSLNDSLLKLQRQARYGNIGTGFNDSRPSDDAYVYRPDASRSLLDGIRQLSDGFGYDFRSNALGSLVLTTRHNPQNAHEIVGGTTTYEPNAYGGTYQVFSSSFSVSQEVYASRIDLAVGRRNTTGILTYTVEASDGTQVANGTFDTALTGETTGIFLYDDRFTLDGDNAVIATLYSGDWDNYVVTISDSSGSLWWLDTIFTYESDPNTTAFPETLQTDEAILKLTTTSQAREGRNHVVVVGKRKASVTDSSKFHNPNNPEHEFFVSTGVDASSIWDPAATNYIGLKSSVIIVDDTVADQDYADWVAQTLLIRQRAPDPNPSIDHTILPLLEPRDPLLVSDEAYSSITDSTKVWVTGFKEKYTVETALSSVDTTSYKEIPSYEPRQDLDLDTIDSVYGGRPAVNVNISYPSLDDATITNAGGNIPTRFTEDVLEQSYTVSTDGNGDYLDMSAEDIWPPIPDSIRIKTTSGIFSHIHRWLKNNPYHKFWHIYDYTAKKLHIPFENGDGGSNYGRGSSGWGASGSSVTISYRGLDENLGVSQVYSGESPFYDPYISELPDGQLIDIQFDALISGYYRVSVWAKKQDGNSPIVVSWLTEPGVDQEDSEGHWEYLQSGKSKQYLWDGVDAVGEWNQIQSEAYSWLARGVFQTEQKPSIGRGYYVWNDQHSTIATISGQKTSGKLTFNDDHYAQFYIKIECQSDIFADTIEPIREVRSDELITTGGQNPQSEIYIYTHLPPPSRMEISEVEDWDPSVGTWDRDQPSEAGWVTSPDSGATIRNGKPIRLTFNALARPGTLFNNDNDYTTFKVFRHVHLNANIYDIFMMFLGKKWTELAIAEQKRLVCRKLTNAENTTIIADTEFRRGDTLETSSGKWVFEPQDFTIDDQELQYANYLQLEDVPEFSINREIGETNSRLILAYMNYLFYVSAYTQDRSGRMVWAIDRSFIDKGKITGHTFTTDFPEDLENYFNRTLLTRQWNDPDYVDDLASDWSIAGANEKYIQFFWRRLEPNDTDGAGVLRLNSTGGNVTGNLETSYTDHHTNGVKSSGRLPGAYSVLRQLGQSPGTLDYFGDWTWEGVDTNVYSTTVNTDPLWIPALTRDFHGYYLVPPMVYPPEADDPKTNCYERVQMDGKEDPAASKVWFSRAYPMDGSTKQFWCGHSAEEFVNDDSSKVSSGLFDYSRQNELLSWEHYRGALSSGQLPVSPVYVQPVAGPYLMNFLRYDEYSETAHTFGLAGNTVRLSAAVSMADVTTRPSSSVYSWFESTFRHEFNWESSTYFPVAIPKYRLHPEFLYTKYDQRKVPSGIVYDAGAWAGWKDDSGGTKLKWYNPITDEGGETRGEDNIFTSQSSPYAVGPETPEKTNMIMSVALVNRRRLVPVAGH